MNICTSLDISRKALHLLYQNTCNLTPTQLLWVSCTKFIRGSTSSKQVNKSLKKKSKLCGQPTEKCVIVLCGQPNINYGMVCTHTGSRSFFSRCTRKVKRNKTKKRKLRETWNQKHQGHVKRPCLQFLKSEKIRLAYRKHIAAYRSAVRFPDQLSVTFSVRASGVSREDGCAHTSPSDGPVGNRYVALGLFMEHCCLSFYLAMSQWQGVAGSFSW